MPRACRCVADRIADRIAVRIADRARGRSASLLCLSVLCISLLCISVLAGCSSGGGAVTVDPQALPSAPSATLPPGFLVPGSLVPGSLVPDGSVVPGDPTAGGRCSLTPVPDGGEATVLADGRLLRTDGHCLADLRPEGVTRVQWSPDGTRALIDGDRVLDATGIRASGFRRDNPDVEWSGARGSSLLAATADGLLVRRSDRGTDRVDLSFLDRHDGSTTHPAGGALVTVGLGSAPGAPAVPGVWLATASGASPRLLVRREAATEIGEPAFDASGVVLYFLVRQSDGTSVVTAYDTGVTALSEPLVTGSVLSRLMVSALSDGAWAVRTGDCASGPTGVTAVFGSPGSPGSFEELGRRPMLRGQSLEPVGWLSERRLLVLARPACGQPGTLWQLGADGSTVPVAAGVDGASARSVRGIPAPLTLPAGVEPVG